MLNRNLGIIGWIGTALVFGAVAIRFLRPEWMQYAHLAAWAGLVCILLYMAGQWRDVGRVLRPARRRATARCRSSASSSCLGILVAVNYLGARQNKRWDLTANQAFSLSEQTVKILQGLDAPVKFTVFDQETTSIASAIGWTDTSTTRTRSASSTWTSIGSPARAKHGEDPGLRHDHRRLQGPHGARDEHRANRT